MSPPTHVTSLAPASCNARTTRLAIGSSPIGSSALSRPMRSLRPPVRTTPLQPSSTIADRFEVGEVGAVEVLGRPTLQEVGDDIRLDGPVHDRLRVGRVARMLGVLAAGVEVHVDETQEVPDLVH